MKKSEKDPWDTVRKYVEFFRRHQGRPLSPFDAEKPDLHSQGMNWWQVGRNASHEFYLGVNWGQLFRLATVDYEAEDEDGNPTGKWIHDENMDAVDPNDPGYVGHV